MTGKKGQMKAVLDYLKTSKKLTSMEAFEMFGCTRLSDKVLKLRRAGYDIETKMVVGENRYGQKCEYAEYILK